MLPSHYACTSCGEKFDFAFRRANYYIGSGDIGEQVGFDDLLEVPLRPAWCKDCGHLCPVEDIAPLRTFEAAYAAAKAGRSVDYPLSTECWDQADRIRTFEAYLRWRMERRHVPRALCCGGTNFQFMDVATPLFKHAECDFGVVEAMTFHLGPSVGNPGPLDIRLYTTEGELIGVLTWRRNDAVCIEKLSYPPDSDDQPPC